MNTKILKPLFGGVLGAAAFVFGPVAIGQTQNTTVYVQPAPTYAPAAVARPAAHPRIVTTNPGAENETGVNGADQEPTTTQKLIDGARAIRQALVSDPATANQDIRISPLNGRITLSGNVTDSTIKSRAEAIANHAASDSLVVSQLKTNQQ